jgi:hypothetical protein
MSNISSLTSREPLSACPPEQNPAMGGSGTPSSVKSTSSRTSVEEYRANDEKQGLVGKALEAGYARLLHTMPAGGKVELSGLGMVKLEYAGEMKLKAEVERLQDGTYQATLRGGLGMGLATPSVKEGVDAAAMLGVQGAVVLRFESAAEAADRLAALTQLGAMRATSLTEWAAVKLGLVDEDASPRSVRALQKLQSFELGVYGELRAELDAEVVKVGARAVGEGTFRVDVADGKLIYESALQVQLQGALHGPAADGGAKWAEVLKGELGTSLAGGGVEGRTLFHAEVTLSQEELTRLQEGTLRPGELMKPERIRKTVTQELKGELVGASFSARRELPVEALGDLSRALDPRGEWDVSASMKASDSLEVEVDVGVAQLRGGVAMEVPLFDKGSRKMSLGKVGGSILQAQGRARSDEQLLLARRALGR